MNKTAIRLEILQATKHEKLILRQMLELHQHDLSPYSNADLTAQGEFGYTYLDQYWTEPQRYPYLAKSNQILIGFALVNSHTHLPRSQYSMAEFFILKRYRRQGIGQAMARHIFQQHLGIWEVGQLPGNEEAIAFWQRTIEQYTQSNFKTFSSGYSNWKGPILQFESPPSL